MVRSVINTNIVTRFSEDDHNRPNNLTTVENHVSCFLIPLSSIHLEYIRMARGSKRKMLLKVECM